MPLLKLFHGRARFFENRKKIVQGERYDLSREEEIKSAFIILVVNRVPTLYILFFPVLFAPRQTLRFIERVGTRARSYDKISRAV